MHDPAWPRGCPEPSRLAASTFPGFSLDPLEPGHRRVLEEAQHPRHGWAVDPQGPPLLAPQLRVLLDHLFAQVVIKTQTEYELTSMDQAKKFPDLEAQKLACGHPEEGHRVSSPSAPRGARAGRRGVSTQAVLRGGGQGGSLWGCFGVGVAEGLGAGQHQADP